MRQLDARRIAGFNGTNVAVPVRADVTRTSGNVSVLQNMMSVPFPSYRNVSSGRGGRDYIRSDNHQESGCRLVP